MPPLVGACTVMKTHHHLRSRGSFHPLRYTKFEHIIIGHTETSSSSMSQMSRLIVDVWTVDVSSSSSSSQRATWAFVFFFFFFLFFSIVIRRMKMKKTDRTLTGQINKRVVEEFVETRVRG